MHLVKRLGENDNSKKVRFNRNIRLNGVRPVATETASDHRYNRHALHK